MSYYARESSTHLDGSPIFTTTSDVTSENEISALLEREWGCEMRRFGLLAPLDWYSTRAGRLVGVLELKTRSHPFAQFPTVFLNVRKWLALTLASTGLGVPALFVVRWADSLGWCSVADVDARVHRIGGCSRRVKSDSDIEPVIEVPVELFRKINLEAT